MSTEALTPEILRGGDSPARKFDPKSAFPFVNKSVSEATRRAYGQAFREFFQFAGMKHPSEVVPDDVVLWRDRLRSQKKSAATVAFRLSVVRSFFEYLKAAGAVTLNPASTKLVSPPELPSEPGLPLVRKKTSAAVSIFSTISYAQRSIVAAIPGRDAETSAKSGRSALSPAITIDHNLSEHRTVHLNYWFERQRLTNLGVGNLNLAETGFSRDSTAHVLRASGLVVIGGRFVNEFRAEYKDSDARNRANAQTPSVVTLNTFVSGGAGVYNSYRSRRLYGVDNAMFDRGIHSLKFGGEVEAERGHSLSANGTNGAFLFATLDDYFAARPSTPSGSWRAMLRSTRFRSPPTFRTTYGSGGTLRRGSGSAMSGRAASRTTTTFLRA